MGAKEFLAVWSPQAVALIDDFDVESAEPDRPYLERLGDGSWSAGG
jgi:hypothetical protein